MAIVGMRNSYVAGAGASDALNPASPAVTGGFAPVEIRPKNWRETLLLLYPNSSEAAKAPLTALTSMMKSESTDDAEFNWFEKILDNRRVAITANLPATSAGAVTVAGGGCFKFKAGDLLLVEATKEVVRVASDPTSDTALTVVRNFTGGGGAGLLVTAASDNPFLTCIGSAFEEGSAAPTGVNFDPTRRYNFCQIYRSTLELTRTASKTRLRTGDAVKEAKRECLETIGVDMERSFWFGQKSMQSLGGKPARTSDGVIQQIKNGNTLANPIGTSPPTITTGKVSVPANGIITMDWLDSFMELAFRFGSHEKLFFGGNPSLLAIQQTIRKNTSYQIHFGEKEYGMQVARLTSPFGTLVCKTHPLWNQMTSTSTLAYPQNTSAANMVVVLDAANLRYRYVDDLKYQPDLTAVGLDGMKSGYLAECGLELQHPNSHIYAEGIMSGAQ